MANPSNPAQARALILERLLGDTGEPDHVIGAARKLAERALPAIVQAFSEKLSAPLGLDIEAVTLARLAEARPTAGRHAATITSSTSSPDALILSMDAAAVTLIVNALFGGDPELPISPIERDLSPTELDVAAMVFEDIALAVNGSGARAFDFKLPLPTVITGAELRKHVIRDGPGVRVVLLVSTPAGVGRISLMMPQRVLLKHRGETAGGEADTNWSARFGEEIMRSAVNLEATMPLARMTLSDIAMLREGQIVDLDENARSDARLSSRGKTLFMCEFGKLGQNYTVRIRHPFDAGQDLMDTLLPG
ncbi:FliM/FliN family flagellar motor switch protein [Pseudaminobacter sp. NGMCC 1.201702]|uniref:FliM/FliN family flagellar motor switch protein n=1 Tax=Pseudaminobacter sp. NGMCC 1.201702 TaxID=3391825 RepID=UPI0039EEAEA2